MGRLLADSDYVYARQCVWTFLRRLPAGAVEFDDLLSAAHLGLVHAAARFDGTSAWTSYAWRRMWGQMQDEMRARNHNVRSGRSPYTFTSLAAPVGDDGLTVGDTVLSPGPATSDLVEARDLLARVIDGVGQLHDRDRDILLRVLGGEPLQRIADDYGVTVSRISQVCSGVRRRLAAAHLDGAA